MRNVDDRWNALVAELRQLDPDGLHQGLAIELARSRLREVDTRAVASHIGQIEIRTVDGPLRNAITGFLVGVARQDMSERRVTTAALPGAVVGGIESRADIKADLLLAAVIVVATMYAAWVAAEYSPREAIDRLALLALTILIFADQRRS